MYREVHSLRGIIGVERCAISLNIALKRRNLLGQLLARGNARLAGIAMEKRPSIATSSPLTKSC